MPACTMTDTGRGDNILGHSQRLLFLLQASLRDERLHIPALRAELGGHYLLANPNAFARLAQQGSGRGVRV